MTTPLVRRLIAECAHLRDVQDPELDALRRALLVEDVLGVRLTDDQIGLETLTDEQSLLALSVDAPPGD